ncbi:hypothetical protein LTR24_005665 [Lithohypha guttulata]|uniref:Uncharacterized protein n=1 Tax=Lithohypha guttulata TaxID=1690604 RepID=A0ABR0K8M0_9EURO|nr:hypothetical protein LTR24_005665 [Lithohypha guttulata]
MEQPVAMSGWSSDEEMDTNPDNDFGTPKPPFSLQVAKGKRHKYTAQPTKTSNVAIATVPTTATASASPSTPVLINPFTNAQQKKRRRRPKRPAAALTERLDTLSLHTIANTSNLITNTNPTANKKPKSPTKNPTHRISKPTTSTSTSTSTTKTKPTPTKEYTDTDSDTNNIKHWQLLYVAELEKKEAAERRAADAERRVRELEGMLMQEGAKGPD